MRTASLGRARREGVAFVAVLVLAAQALIPHFHAIPTASHRVSAGTATAACSAACPVVDASTPAGDRDGHRHSPATCPLCRAQSDAGSSLVPTAFVLPLAVAASANDPVDLAAPLSAGVRTLAAPRAPPFAS